MELFVIESKRAISISVLLIVVLLLFIICYMVNLLR